LQDSYDEDKNYSAATITDHLPSYLDGSTVKNATVSFGSSNGGISASGGQTITANAPPFLQQMKDGGVLYLNSKI